jgi:hypothetical protein
MWELIKAYEIQQEDWYIIWMLGASGGSYISYKIAEKKEIENLKYFFVNIGNLAVIGIVGKIIWDTLKGCLTIW